MDDLSHLRHMIASMDEVLTDALCRRARFHLNAPLYALPGASPGAPAQLAGPFAEAPTLAGRVGLLRPAYLCTLLPRLCRPGVDDSPAACLSADAACLDGLARRLTLSVHVATRKREALPEPLQAAIRTGDPARVEEAITHPRVEDDVIARVRSRADGFSPGSDLPDRLAGLYADWIIPLSRKIQVHGLLAAPA